jgi:iron complex outermembrane receptor protein
MRTFKPTLMAVTFLAAAASAFAQTGDSKVEEIVVLGERRTSTDVPTAEEMAYRFLLRPGAESIVSEEMLREKRVSSLQDVFEFTPGVFTSSRDQGTGGLLSIRGSDIATEGPRNGRGVRGYIDGVPLGRTEAGLTAPLIDLLAASYVEVYRGGSSLRYGALSSGGSINFVSKTGANNPGTGIRLLGGSFGFVQGQVEHGGQNGDLDYYASISGQRFDGYRPQSAGDTTRLTSNLGWLVSDDVRTRFYLTVGSTNQETAGTIPLDQIRQLRRTTDELSLRADTDANFDFYVRAANKTQIDLKENGLLEFSAFALHTSFDHLPTPFSGIVDNVWREGGVGVRWENSLEVFGVPIETVLGSRYTYTDGDFKRWAWKNGGHDRGQLVLSEDFTAEILEVYGETAIELAPSVKGFLGFQAVRTTRDLKDTFTGPPVRSVPIFMPGGPQPGSRDGDYSNKVTFSDFVPKIGVNWEWRPDNVVFANVTKAFEAPTGSDVANIVDRNARLPDLVLPDIKAQEATTFEVGFRGGIEGLRYDVTAYHSRIKHEILTRCADEVSPTCNETIAFNADRTIHQGVEVGAEWVIAQNVVTPGANLVVDLTGAWQDFYFDGDSRFGDNRLPNVPKVFAITSLRWGGETGIYLRAVVRYTGDRRTTYDGSGGSAFVVPDVTTLGATLGWRNERLNIYVEGRNLTDKAYAADFSATPTVPMVQSGPVPTRATSPNVRPGDGRAVYAGINLRF